MDLVVQSSSGLLSITGTEDGKSVRCGYGVTDVTAGLFAVIGILLALRARETNGAGQFVDVAMLDGMISTMSSNYMSYLGSGIVPRPMGTAFPTVVPYRVFETQGSRNRHRRRKRKALAGILYRDRPPGPRTAPGLLDQCAAHSKSRRARAAAGGGVRPASGRQSGSRDCRRRAFRPRSFAISRRWPAPAVAGPRHVSRSSTIPRPVAM